MATLTIRDETAPGKTTGELTLDVLDETITVRERIKFNGLVTPRDGRNVYLPFEGDQTLSVIPSKAFLLADDAKITDETIRNQIKL